MAFRASKVRPYRTEAGEEKPDGDAHRYERERSLRCDVQVEHGKTIGMLARRSRIVPRLAGIVCSDHATRCNLDVAQSQTWSCSMVATNPRLPFAASSTFPAPCGSASVLCSRQYRASRNSPWEIVAIRFRRPRSGHFSSKDDAVLQSSSVTLSDGTT